MRCILQKQQHQVALVGLKVHSSGNLISLDTERHLNTLLHRPIPLFSRSSRLRTAQLLVFRHLHCQSTYPGLFATMLQIHERPSTNDVPCQKQMQAEPPAIRASIDGYETTGSIPLSSSYQRTSRRPSFGNGVKKRGSLSDSSNSSLHSLLDAMSPHFQKTQLRILTRLPRWRDI